MNWRMKETSPPQSSSSKAYGPTNTGERSQMDVRLPQSIDELPEDYLDQLIAKFEPLAAKQRAARELESRKLLEAGPVVEIQATESSPTG